MYLSTVLEDGPSTRGATRRDVFVNADATITKGQKLLLQLTESGDFVIVAASRDGVYLYNSLYGQHVFITSPLEIFPIEHTTKTRYGGQRFLMNAGRANGNISPRAGMGTSKDHLLTLFDNIGLFSAMVGTCSRPLIRC